ncbi:unnamed protein product [Pedinophyceae sp. YPF-701]|nr:unnamed protein product [Pedinophyceae sp. YPF-701]
MARGKRGAGGSGTARGDKEQRAAELEAELFGTCHGAQAFDDEAGAGFGAAEMDDILAGGAAGEDDDDRAGHGEGAGDDEEDGSEPEDRDEAPTRDAGPAKATGKRRPVWVDEDDEKVEVNIAGRAMLRKLRKKEDEETITGKQYEQRLRQQFRKLNPGVKWSRLTHKESTAGASEAAARILQHSGAVLSSARATLPPGLIEATRVRDANQHEPCKAVVRSVAFHPGGQILMTASLDRKLRLFQADGLRNPKLQSVHFDDMPIHQAAFCNGGAQILCTGRRRFWYLYDVEAAKVQRVQGIFGRDERSFERFAATPADADPASLGPAGPLAAFCGVQGNIPLVSLRSRQAVGTLKMSGTVRNLAFTPGRSHELLSSGDDGVVYVWDLRTQRCRGRAVDEGCVHATSLAVSPGGNYVAAGSDVGVVNIYGPGGLFAGAGQASQGAAAPLAPLAPRPVKTLMHLTTAADTLEWSPDGQVLAMASRMRKDALRLVHVPTLTVFSNWPTSKSPLHYVHCVAFSPGGGFLAVGNAKGRALLYRLHHFDV